MLLHYGRPHGIHPILPVLRSAIAARSLHLRGDKSAPGLIMRGPPAQVGGFFHSWTKRHPNGFSTVPASAPKARSCVISFVGHDLCQLERFQNSRGRPPFRQQNVAHNGRAKAELTRPSTLIPGGGDRPRKQRSHLFDRKKLLSHPNLPSPAHTASGRSFELLPTRIFRRRVPGTDVSLPRLSRCIPLSDLRQYARGAPRSRDA